MMETSAILHEKYKFSSLIKEALESGDAGKLLSAVETAEHALEAVPIRARATVLVLRAVALGREEAKDILDTNKEEAASWAVEALQARTMYEGSKGRNPLHESAANGHNGVVATLIALRNQDLNAADADGCTAILLSSEFGHELITTLLLEAGADPNIKSTFGSTAILRSARDNHVEVVKILLRGGADPNVGNSQMSTAILMASMNGHYHAVHELIKGNADPNIVSNKGNTALLKATENEHLSIATLLCRNGADVNHVGFNDKMQTALMLAAKANSLSFVDMLIEHGADPNVRTDDDGTAVSFAAQYGFEEVLVRLLKAGGDPLLENKIGQNARARALGKPHIIALLDNRPFIFDPISTVEADPKASNDKNSTDGRRPFDIAVRWCEVAGALELGRRFPDLILSSSAVALFSRGTEVTSELAEIFLARAKHADDMPVDSTEVLAVAAESGCDASVLRLVAAAYPKGATHESVRHRLRAAFDANDVATVAAVGVVAALVTFEVYHQWRLGSNKDIDISAGMPEVAKQRAAIGKRRRSSHIISPDQGSVLPCEPLVQLLLASGVEAERLLLEAAASPTASFARVLLQRNLAGGLVPLGDARVTARSVGVVSQIAEVVALFRPLGTFLGRYELNGGPAVHVSATCVVVFGLDLMCGNTPVALKRMKDRRLFMHELIARKNLPDSHDLGVIGIIGAHCPVDDAATAEMSAVGWKPEVEATNPEGDDMDYPYVLSMPQGERSLENVIAAERLAGIDTKNAIGASLQVAHALRSLHSKNLVHCDLKPRNIVRLAICNGDSKDNMEKAYTLIDLDASASVGELCGGKSSTACGAPELARARYGADPRGKHPPSAPGPVVASLKLDIWSFGVMLFELGSGRDLFRKDLSNDELVGSPNALLAWVGISDASLAEIFASPEAVEHCDGDFPRLQSCFRHLCRWCLMADPRRRPSIEQVLAHPLFHVELPEPEPLPELYFGFLSHMQAQAAADAGAIFALLGRYGLGCWWDMRQSDLTLHGMMDGVRNSRVFILILTADVLTRPFCQKELLTAINEGKRIIALVEVDPRFYPFDRLRFHKAAREVKDFLAIEGRTPGSGEFPHDLLFKAGSPEEYVQIVLAVSKALETGLAIRRRDHEAGAMAMEIARLGGFVLPSTQARATRSVPQAMPGDITVHILGATPPGNDPDLSAAISTMRMDVKAALALASGIRLSDEISSADCVMVLLTAKFLDPGSASTAALQRVLLEGEERKLLLIHLPPASGLAESASFDFSEASSELIKNCLSNNEALAFRPRDDSFGIRGECNSSASEGVSHEWRAMADRLASLLGRSLASSRASAPAVPTELLSDVHERLADALRRLALNEAGGDGSNSRGESPAAPTTAATVARIRALEEENSALKALLASSGKE